MWSDTRLLDLFAIAHPLVQAPMAGSSGVDMAVAVSEAGALGSLPAAALDAVTLRERLQGIRQRTSRPVNINFFAHPEPAPDDAADVAWLTRLSCFYEEFEIDLPDALTNGGIKPFGEAHCTVVEEMKPQIVSFHFGLPRPDLTKRIWTSGAKVVSTATTVAEARWLAERGCDAIIAQGMEAGGHRGMFLSDDPGTQMGTLALVPRIVDAVDVPVIAAGGIADGRGIAAALALGAAGVQIGTAYLFTEEATINAVYRAALRDASESGTAVTRIFSGRPARCLVNRAVRELQSETVPRASFPRGFTAMSPLRHAAEKTGSRDFSAHYCGEAASLCRTMPAAALTCHLADDAQSRIRQLAGGD